MSVFAKTEVRDLRTALDRLPAFPRVAHELMELVIRTDVNLKEVARLVEADAVFSGEVLRLANSALFGLRYRVDNTLQAIAILGLNRLQGLVITIAMRNFLHHRRVSEHLTQIWRHNLASAVAAEWIAGCNWYDKAAAYTAGLLHEVGLLGVVTVAEPDFLQARERAWSEGRDLLECERELFGMDHADAGLHLAQMWNLPTSLLDVITPTPIGRRSAGLTLRDIAWSACILASHCGFPAGLTPPEAKPGPLRLSGNLDPSVYNNLPDLRDDLPRRVNLFECNLLP
jgi:HD-like signal output (HDOD) protein